MLSPLPARRPERVAYPPKVMVALLLYAYCTGIRSSRKIEGPVEGTWRLGDRREQGPDRTAISRFRQKFEGLSRRCCGRVGGAGQEGDGGNGRDENGRQYFPFGRPG